MPSSHKTDVNSVSAYEVLLPRLEQVRADLVAALALELGASGVRLAAPIASRLKTWDSILGKLERGVAGIKDFRQYYDLIGIRVVVPFRTDVAAACAAIRNVCQVVEEYDTGQRLGDDRFGYVASHLIVRLRRHARRGDGPDDQPAEIQVLTAAQNVWSQSSHVLQYKASEATPSELRRSVHRVAALLELVDLEFERLLVARDEYRRSLQLENDQLALDVDVLDAALPHLWPRQYPYDPSLNETLLRALERHGITTLGDLRRLVATQQSAVLADSLQHAKDILEAVDHGVRNGDTYTLTGPTSSRSMSGLTPELIARARRGVFYAMSGLTFTALQFAFGQRTPPPGTGQAFSPSAG